MKKQSGPRLPWLRLEGFAPIHSPINLGETHYASDKGMSPRLAPNWESRGSPPPRLRQSVQFSISAPRRNDGVISSISIPSSPSIASHATDRMAEESRSADVQDPVEATISSRSASRNSTHFSYSSTPDDASPQRLDKCGCSQQTSPVSDDMRSLSRRVSLRFMRSALRNKTCDGVTPRLAFTPVRRHHASASSRLATASRRNKEGTRTRFSFFSESAGERSVRSVASPTNTVTSLKTRSAQEEKQTGWRFPSCKAKPQSMHAAAFDNSSSLREMTMQHSSSSLSNYDSEMSECPSLFHMSNRARMPTYGSLSESRYTSASLGKPSLVRAASIRIGMVTRPCPSPQGKGAESAGDLSRALRASQSLTKHLSPPEVPRPHTIVVSETVVTPYYRRKLKFPPSSYRPEYMRGAPVSTLNPHLQKDSSSTLRNQPDTISSRPSESRYLSGLYGIGRYASGPQASTQTRERRAPQPMSADMPRPLSHEEKLSLMMHHKNAMGIRLERRQEIAAKILAKDDEEAIGVLRSCRIRRCGEFIDSPRRLQHAFRPTLGCFSSNYGSEKYLPLRIAPELSNWSRLMRNSTKNTEDDEKAGVQSQSALLTLSPKRSPSSASTRASSSGSLGLKKKSGQRLLDQCWCLDLKSLGSMANVDHHPPPPTPPKLPSVVLTPAEFSAFENGCRLRPPHPVTLETVRASEWLLFSDGSYVMLILARSWARYEPNFSLTYFPKRRSGSPWVGKHRSVLSGIFLGKTHLRDLHDTILQDLSASIAHLNLHQLTFLRHQLPTSATSSGREELRNFSERLDNCITECVCNLICEREGFKLGASVFHRLQSSLLNNKPIDLTPPNPVSESSLTPFYPRPPAGLSQRPLFGYRGLRRGVSRVSSNGLSKSFETNSTRGDDSLVDERLARAKHQFRSTDSEQDLDSELSRRHQLRKAFTKWEKQSIGRRIVIMFGCLLRLSSSLHKFLEPKTTIENVDVVESSLQTWWFVPLTDILRQAPTQSRKKIDRLNTAASLASRDTTLKSVSGKPRYLFVRFPSLVASTVRPAGQLIYSLRTSMVPNRGTTGLQFWDLRELPASGEIRSLEPPPSVSDALRELLNSSLFLRLQAQAPQGIATEATGMTASISRDVKWQTHQGAEAAWF